LDALKDFYDKAQRRQNEQNDRQAHQVVYCPLDHTIDRIFERFIPKTGKVLAVNVETRDALSTDIGKILHNQQANTGLSCDIRDLAEPLSIERKFQEDDLPDALLSNNTVKHCQHHTDVNCLLESQLVVSDEASSQQRRSIGAIADRCNNPILRPRQRYRG
jgi:hypothetical protein